ncbi:dihydrofolate reductase family protein [Persicobacter psychrovividus]|uniref:Dihydrofolate reductase n=1 Tax=Persicobacter psychrovividus TaxID=387638 RepID=A0ABM7VGN4_9BACT|nr:dihydrofolate reductase [Persicobacter psychrovividus]
MNKLQLYIASSLDGYIARQDGSLDWLYAVPNPDQLDYGYADFLNGVDVILMGRQSYEEILGFGVDWPYPEHQTYIVTTQADYKAKTPNTMVLNELNAEVLTSIQREKNVWLLGGGQLVGHCLNHELIDEMMICLIPTIIGGGIPLFPSGVKETGFDLVSSENYPSGVLMLTYKKK